MDPITDTAMGLSILAWFIPAVLMLETVMLPRHGRRQR